MQRLAWPLAVRAVLGGLRHAPERIGTRYTLTGTAQLLKPLKHIIMQL